MNKVLRFSSTAPNFLSTSIRAKAENEGASRIIIKSTIVVKRKASGDLLTE